MAQITIVKHTPLESLNLASSITQRDIYQAVDIAARRTADDFVVAYTQTFQSEGAYASHAAFTLHQSLKKRAVKQAENKVMDPKDSFIVGAKAFTYIRLNANEDTAQLLKMIPQARRDAIEKIEIKMSTVGLLAELQMLKDFFPSVTSIDLSVKGSKALNMTYNAQNREMSGGVAPNYKQVPIPGLVKVLKEFPKLETVVMKNVTTQDILKVALKEGLPGQSLQF